MQRKTIVVSGVFAFAMVAMLATLFILNGSHASAADNCGDLDGNGAVEAIDIILVSDYWQDPSPPAQADMNKDGVVDLANDILRVIIQFGETTSCQSAPLPKTEPAGGALAVDAVGESTSEADTIQLIRSEEGGVPFTVSVHVSSNPGTLHGAGVRLHWDEALLDLVDNGTSLWRERADGFGFLDSNNGDDGIGNEAWVEAGGTTFFPDQASWSGTGPVVQFSFVCHTAGTANLTLSDAGSHSALFGRPGIEYTPALANAQINCLSDGPTPTLTPTPEPPTNTPTLTPCPSPCLALTPTPTFFGKVAVTSGNIHSCSLNDHGGVMCWNDSSGSLPAAVPGLETGVVAIASGVYHNCALTTAGGVLCWGSDSVGQVGNGGVCDAHNCPTPVGVIGLSSGVVAIAAGGHSSCAITSSGGLKCWGHNRWGQLGDGTTTSRTTPVDVLGLTSGVVSVGVGAGATCAVTTSGGLKCWGDNDDGEVGDGTTTERHTPTNVTGLSSGVAAVSSGINHTCALTVTGGLKCWGGNAYGQLGIGTTADSSTPADVVGLSSGVAAVGAAQIGLHTCAITTGGALKCWGRNAYGQVGDGTTTNRTTPVNVVGLDAGVVAVAGGGWHTCALQWGGAKCWGQNQYGQLGDGTTTSSTTPVNVDKGFEPTPTPTPCGGPCPTATATLTPTITPTSTPTPTPKDPDADIDGDTIPNSSDPDDDNDGCTDVQENGTDERLGGLRNPHNPWDFYDVLGGGGGPPDGVIDLPNDVLGVIQHFSPDGVASYDVIFDRGPSTGPDPWNMTAPDGAIDLPNDILGVIMQFSHNCTT